MTHEHSGEGGIMDRSEKYLDKKCGDDEGARQRNFMLSLVKPKAERKKLNRRILHLGVNVIFCYRALDKVKPVQGKEPMKLGWQPETTSPLHYEMTARFLLGPGSDGVPTLIPDTPAERVHTKNPDQFRGWWDQGMQLTEDVGENMARWCAGENNEYRFPRGDHEGKTVEEAPLDYLMKLAESDKTTGRVRGLVEAEIRSRAVSAVQPEATGDACPACYLVGRHEDGCPVGSGDSVVAGNRG